MDIPTEKHHNEGLADFSILLTTEWQLSTNPQVQLHCVVEITAAPEFGLFATIFYRFLQVNPLTSLNPITIQS